MIDSMAERKLTNLHLLQMKFRSFLNNFSWPDWVWVYDSPMSRSAYLIPVIGYIVVFNDYATSLIDFKNISGVAPPIQLVSNSGRLKFLYFGLVFIGVSNLYYVFRRPVVMKIGNNQIRYVEEMLKNITLSRCIGLHESIMYNKNGHKTLYGEYDIKEWELFLTDAVGGTYVSAGFTKHQEPHWNNAKSKHELLLRSILIETYFRETTTRIYDLVICLTIGIIGYVLLVIPSLDLFLRISSSIL